MLDLRRIAIICTLSVALPAALVLSLIVRAGDVSILSYFGSELPSSDFIRANYPGARFPDPIGHDGSAFYVVSRAFPDLDRAAANLDDPAYRIRRILVPIVLHPFAGRAYTVALLVLTLVAIAAGALCLSILLQRAGFPWWLGISLGLSPGVLFATRFGLPDVIALALMLVALVVIERRPWLGVFALTAAALTRETSLVAAAALFLAVPKARRYVLIPVAITVAWILWVDHSFANAQHPLIVFPFSDWFSHGAGAATFAIILFAGSLAGAWTLRRRATVLALVMAGEAVLLALLASLSFFGGNFMRVVPLSVTGMLTLAISRRQRDVAISEGEAGRS